MELNLFKEQAQAHGRFQKEDVVSIKECMEIPNLRQRGKYAKIVASLIGGAKCSNCCRIHFRGTSKCSHCNLRRPPPQARRSGIDHVANTLKDEEEIMRLTDHHQRKTFERAGVSPFLDFVDAVKIMCGKQYARVKQVLLPFHNRLNIRLPFWHGFFIQTCTPVFLFSFVFTFSFCVDFFFRFIIQNTSPCPTTGTCSITCERRVGRCV